MLALGNTWPTDRSTDRTADLHVSLALNTLLKKPEDTAGRPGLSSEGRHQCKCSVCFTSELTQNTAYACTVNCKHVTTKQHKNND
jgi:hypothetical protein